MSYTQDAWKEIAPLFEAMVAQPFNQELAAGTLSHDRFCYYMIQDAHYLGMFSKALAVASAKAPNARGQVILSHAAHDAIVVERALHEEFFGHFGLTSGQVDQTPLSPTCLAYGHFLVSTAHSTSYAGALGALLPCFQIYWEVGKRLFDIAAADNPYRKWIDTYVDDEYSGVVKNVIALTDEAHDGASSLERATMHDAYLHATRLEWMFWDAAYRMEDWPV